MTNALTITNKGLGLLIVDGELTFETITQKTSDAFNNLPSTKQVIVDLAGVMNVDSAGLAILIEWLKITRSKRIQLQFRNIPDQLLNLAKLSGLDKTDYFSSHQLTPNLNGTHE